MDLTPSANDKLHADTLETASKDEAVDGLIISYDTMAPATKDFPAPGTIEGYTDAPDSFSNLLAGLMARLEKPIVVFNDVGRVHEPLNAKLEKTGVPVFDTCGHAMVALGRYMDYRLKVQKLRNK
jgi:acyl-CoA synthetase (NDP forming)